MKRQIPVQLLLILFFLFWTGLSDLHAACIKKIMPLGDSITVGFDPSLGPNNVSGYWAGYRKPLYLSLQNSGYQPDFVGSQADGQLAGNFDYDHEGHGGQTAAYIASNIYGWLSMNPADIILLHIGTNDLNINPQNTGAADVEAILNEIDNFSTDVIVVIARIIQTNPPQSYITQFNNNVQAMAEARIAAGDKIVIVNQENALTQGDMSDSLHPNEQGYAKMANVWFNALNGSLMLCLPDISVSPASYDYGEVYLNNEVKKTFTLANSGPGDFAAGSSSITGTNAADFTIVKDLCSGNIIGSAGSCNIAVLFTPGTQGSKAATLRISSTNKGDVNVPLSGTGISAGNDIPSRPQLVSPDDGAVISGNTVKLVWKNSVDPNGDTVTYKVYCCKNQDFSACEPQGQTGTSALILMGTGLFLCGFMLMDRKKFVLSLGLMIFISIFLISCGLGQGGDNKDIKANESSFDVQNLETGTTYYWKIVADDGKGGTNESYPRNFSTQ